MVSPLAETSYKTSQPSRQVPGARPRHRHPRLTLHRRHDDRWDETSAGPGEHLSLESLAADLAVDDVYRGGLEDVG
jgi:hypothetical protein